MVRRPRSHEIEDLSRDSVRKAFNSMGWTVEDLRKDYGEDLLVRIFDGGVATQLMFFVQCKGTDNVNNYILGSKAEILIPVKRRHVKHWDQFWEPVILSVWDSKADRTYWECVQSYVSTDKGKTALAKAEETKADTLRIPVTNALDRDGLTRIQSITRIRFERFEREKHAAQLLVQLIEDKFKVRVDYGPEAGILGFKAPGEPWEGYAFGRTAEMLNTFSELSGCPLEDAGEKLIRIALDFIENATPEDRDLIRRRMQQMDETLRRGEED